MKEYSETITKQIKKLENWYNDPNADIYKDGWDSYDAKAITQESIEKAINFLKGLDYTYIKSCFVCPCSDGKMHFEIALTGE